MKLPTHEEIQDMCELYRCMDAYERGHRNDIGYHHVLQWMRWYFYTVFVPKKREC